MSMATAIDDTELNISSYSITATILTPSTEDDYNITCKWNDWSPVIDWDALLPDHDDISDLIQSVVDSGGLEPSPVTHGTSIDTMSVGEGTNFADSKGLRLVHLLMAAAEALTGVNKSYDLARVILIRLKELVSPNEGTNMERLAAYFTNALYGLVDGAGGLHGKHLIGNGHHYNHLCDERHVLAAFQLLQDISPCVKFGHFTANQAILEAVAQDGRVHIVDYDIMEGIQWASLMQALVSRKDGPPVPHLRITALSRSKSRGSIGTVQETGRRLIAFAASIGQPFSFHHCRLDSDDTFRAAALKLVRGEALVINCMLNLPHFNYRAPNSIISFLSGVKTLGPRLVTLVEEVTGTVGDGGFVSQFMNSLHHYSAFCDSLETGFPIPMKDQVWTLVERVFLGPRIAGSLSRIYQAGGTEPCSWWEWLGSVGYKPANISFANHCQAKLLLGLFNDGYRVEELANNRLVLGWKSRDFFSASIWTSSPESGY